MAELKKCPFCGGEAEIDWALNNNNDTLWEVECTNCGCSLHFSPNKSKEEAIEAWNNRVTEAEIRAKAYTEIIEAIKEHTKVVGSTTCEDLDEIAEHLAEQLKVE